MPHAARAKLSRKSVKQGRCVAIDISLGRLLLVFSGKGRSVGIYPHRKDGVSTSRARWLVWHASSEHNPEMGRWDARHPTYRVTGRVRVCRRNHVAASLPPEGECPSVSFVRKSNTLSEGPKSNTHNKGVSSAGFCR